MFPGLLAAVSAGSLLIRTGEVDITPDVPLPLGGYTARGSKLSEPGGEPLKARILELETGGKKVAIVACDLLTIPDSLYREVRARIPKDIELMLCATHTHCAPDSQMLNDRMTFSVPGIASFRRQWLDWYANHIARGVNSTIRSLGGHSEFVSCAEFQASLNRGRRRDAVPDESADLLTSRGGNLLFTYSAHPVFFGPERLQTSGDWPGEVSRKLGCPVVVGAIGDVSPKADGVTPEARIANFARTLQMRMLISSQAPLGVWRVGEPLRMARETIELPAVTAHPTMGKAYGVPQKMAEAIVQKFAPTSANITALRLGKLAIVGVPGEPTSHLGRAIKAYGLQLGFSRVLVISHVNGWIGYILDRADYDQGGYEATLSFYGREEGEKVVDAARKALRRLTG